MKWPNEVQVTLPTRTRAAGNKLQLSAKARRLVTEYYEDEVPYFVSEEIAQHYGNLFSARPHFRQTGQLTDTTNTYITRKKGTVEILLLFDRNGQQVIVLNQLIQMSKMEAHDFSAFVFSRSRSCSRPRPDICVRRGFG